MLKIQNMHMLKWLAVLSGAIAVLSAVALLRYTVFNHQRGGVRVDETADITYLVNLKDNQFFDTTTLGPDLNYLQTYTDYISAYYTYQADFSSIIDVTYHYRMLITPIARYKGVENASEKPVIIQKNYEIEADSGSLSTNALALNYAYDLRLEKYREQLEDFASTLQIPIGSEVRVDFVIDLQSDEFASSFTRSMTVPLSTEFYTIAMGGEPYKTNAYNITNRTLNTQGQIGLVFTILIGALLLFVAVKHMRSEKSSFRHIVDGYLKTYRDIIVHAKEAPDFTAYEIVHLENFHELVQLAAKLALPVLYVDERLSAKFYVAHDNIAYMHELKNIKAEQHLQRLLLPE